MVKPFNEFCRERMSLEDGKRLCNKIAANDDQVTMIITIDSNSKKSGTADRDSIFKKHGFFRKSPKGIDLPESTYMGKVDSEDAGKAEVEKIWDELGIDLEPTKICGGIVNNWKVIKAKNSKDK